jgi:uncharacterized protein YqhQ
MTENKKELKNYGGQALIEGVLMRGNAHVVGAFRKPDNSIFITSEKLSGIYMSPLRKIPFLRGLVVLWDSLFLGMKYLTLSANLQTGEDEQKIEGPALIITMFISFGFAIGLFFILPAVLAELITKLLKISPLTINLLEGFIRLFILIGYIWLIGRSKEITRVFAYHGAEHQTINAFEKGLNLSIEAIKNQPLAHPRCGTSFLLSVVLISIIFFSVIGPLPFGVKIVTRILLIPVISMFAYEFIRWMGNTQENIFTKALSSPNLLLQKLTTRIPDENQLEIALSSFKSLLELENQQEI